jgi:two-component system NtrC family sensor kinase
MASIGQLAAGVAHEINNPMGFIISNLGSLGRYIEKLNDYIGSIEMLCADRDVSFREIMAEERKKYKVERICKDMPDMIHESLDGAARVRKIVQDLKSFSRIDTMDHVSADINEGLESTLSIVWNELKYKESVTKDYGQLPSVCCNLGQLNQVFMNILVNAAQAIDSQGNITITTRSEGENVRIVISDSGNGIPPESLKHIFDPFYTTKEVGKGTGLGLAIAYDIVTNKHGGRIEARSEVGHGTTFTIILPLKSASCDKEAKTAVEPLCREK